MGKLYLHTVRKIAVGLPTGPVVKVLRHISLEHEKWETICFDRYTGIAWARTDIQAAWRFPARLAASALCRSLAPTQSSTAVAAVPRPPWPALPALVS